MACVMLLCTTALAANLSGDCNDEEDDDVSWTLDSSDGTLTISGYGNMANYDDDTNRPPWEPYSSSIKTVYVSGRVSSLGSYAFYGYQNLKRVTINTNSGVKPKICGYAFANSSVEEIQLPSETRSIDLTAFSGCTYLSSIRCGEDMSHYRDFPNGNFPTSYYSLISYLCQGRQFVKYPPHRYEYKRSIPNAMTSIAPYAFAELQLLNEVGIPASVQEIGANAFSGNSLKDVVFFGAPPKTVAANAFDFDGTIHCFCRYADSFRKSSLYNEEKGTWCSVPLKADLHKWVIDAKSGEIKCADCGTTEGLTFRSAFPDPAFRFFITNDVLKKPENFNDDLELTDDILQNIADNIINDNTLSVFMGDYSSAEGARLFLRKATSDLEIITFNQYLQTLDLSNCPSLYSLTCSYNLLKRLDLDSENYPGLKYAIVDGQHIYDETPILQGDRYNNYHFKIKDLLGEDVDLSRVKITDNNATMNEETGEVIYNSAPTAVHYEYNTGLVYDNGREVWMDVTWTPKTQPSDVLVTYSGDCGADLKYEFDNEGVLTITGSGDMWDYSSSNNRYGSIPWASFNIKKLVVGEGCTSICQEAFKQKHSIEEAVFLCDTLNIGENAFFNCESLKSVDFSKCGILTLGDQAFWSCIQLTSITFNNSDTAVINPGRYVFGKCSALSAVHLPKGVTMDGTYNSGLAMFSGCTSLKTATVDCAYIGPMTFECGSLDRITFTDPDVKFYYFHTGEKRSGHPINVACQTELVGYDCSEVHKLVNEKYKSNGVSLTFKKIEGDTGEHKNVVTVPADAATCTKTGLTEGSRCSDCDTWIVEQKEIPMLDHTLVTDAGYAPTVGTPGKTDGSHCSVCSTVIVAQEDIPAWVTAVKYEDGQLTVTVSDDAKGQLILAAYRKNGQLSQLFLPTASSSGTYTLTVDAATDFKWKAFFADSAFAPAQYAYELNL